MTVQLTGPPGPFSLQVGIGLRGQTIAGVAPIGRLSHQSDDATRS